MRHALLSLVAALFLLTADSQPVAAASKFKGIKPSIVPVKPYRKKDGTLVDGHSSKLGTPGVHLSEPTPKKKKKK